MTESLAMNLLGSFIRVRARFHHRPHPVWQKESHSEWRQDGKKSSKFSKEARNAIRWCYGEKLELLWQGGMRRRIENHSEDSCVKGMYTSYIVFEMAPKNKKKGRNSAKNRRPKSLSNAPMTLQISVMAPGFWSAVFDQEACEKLT